MNHYSINNKQSYLVSIIVPAYNAEKYIEKCLLSILNQKYTNIEVIVINDGSTDNTLHLINEISRNDTRVIVVNNDNSGVSVSRNIGIEKSKGEYLIFVDSDDYISSDYVDYMLSLVEQTGSEFCLSKYCFTNVKEHQTEHESIIKLTPEDATALLLSPEVVVGCWNKIFKRSLIMQTNAKFSTTLFYGEGLTFITYLSQRASSVGVGNRKVYYYRRNNELSATTKFDIDKLYNGEKALNGIKENLIIESSKINKMMNLHLSLFSLGAITRIHSNGVKKKYLSDYNHWKSNIGKNLFETILSKDISYYRKILLFSGYLSPYILMKLDLLRKKRIVKNSFE